MINANYLLDLSFTMENGPVKNGEPALDTVINRVSVKQTEFSEAAASGWFFTIEASFNCPTYKKKAINFTRLWQLFLQLKCKVWKFSVANTMTV